MGKHTKGYGNYKSIVYTAKGHKFLLGRQAAQLSYIFVVIPAKNMPE